MRRIRLFFLTTLVLLCGALTSWAEPYSGTPSASLTQIDGNYASYGLTEEFDGYYVISSAEDLYGFAALINGSEDEETLSANAVLTANIVVNEQVFVYGALNGTTTLHNWTPIGTKDKPFKGIFDGNGHTISGLYFNNPLTDVGNYVGLIGYANTATIKNVGILDTFINGNQYVGGICGYSTTTSTTTQTNCYNLGIVLGNSYVGGICSFQGTQIDCYNTGTITSSSSYAGGISGYGGRQTDCYNTGTVSGETEYAGGICGRGGTQTNCYNTGTVSNNSYVGGISGYYGIQTNCYNTGTVSGNSYVGGIGGDKGTQTNCYYLESCGSRNALGVAVTAEELASGKVTYLLNESTSGDDNVWRQNLGNNSDASPVLDKNHAVVYNTSHPCESTFSNDNNEIVKEHPSMDEYGYCTACGLFIAQGTLIKEDNYTEYGFTAENWEEFENYYAISNAGELYWFAKEVNNGNASIKAVLTDNIVVNRSVINESGNLNGTPTYSWTPIGISGKPFKGIFDGNGHTVSGLYFNNTTNKNYPEGGNYVGLIGYSVGAQIKNVGVIDSYINGYQNVGGISGYSGTITNCFNMGSVTGSYYYVGGISGRYGTITNCYNKGTIKSTSSYIGGICGSDGTQTNCHNSGTISGSYFVGGICGANGTQNNCYYLTGCGSVNSLGISATAAKFASGEITYLLNESTSGDDNVWRQTLGNNGDAYPVLDKNHAAVYLLQPCTSGFCNTEVAVKQHPSMDATGLCTDCKKFIAQEATLVTESNYSSYNLTADYIGYYAISNTVDLYWFANEVNNGDTTINGVLTDNITVNETVLNADGTLNGTPTYKWTPIGTTSNGFNGTFDGNNHTISGLYLFNTQNRDYPNGGNHIGLFGNANGATIVNVGVINSYFKGYSYVGGICGYCSNTTIANCHNTGTVMSSNQYIGGICGYSISAPTPMTNCYNTGTVTGSSGYVGGVCGYGGYQTNCYNTGTVTGSGDCVGGICSALGIQSYCHNTGKVTGSGQVGGICGRAGYQEYCYNTGRISGTGYNYVGGICGWNGDVNYCYNTGTVSGIYNVGGICGYYGGQGHCYNAGRVSGSYLVGSICGKGGTRINCYYLSGSATDGKGTVQFGVGGANYNQTTADVSGETTRTYVEDLASGKITYLLNGSTSGENNKWRQDLGDDGDAYPVLDNNHGVVYLLQPCTSEYSNSNTVKEHPSMNIDGRCSACGKFIAPEATLVTESNYSSYNLTADYIGYYAISNSVDLYWFANWVNNGENDENSANAVLTDNIEINQNVLKENGYPNNSAYYRWTPIGTYYKPFKGTFDGKGHTIKGLVFSNNGRLEYPDGGTFVGLIGYADGATIKNVGVIDSYIRGYLYVGGICGCGGTQENCFNSGTVESSNYYAGGICGSAGTQINCYNKGMILGISEIGGICGVNGTQTNCYNTGTITGSNYRVGGICGVNGTQENCYYLAGCAKDGNDVEQNGVGIGTKGQTTADVPGETTSATTEEFANGKIGYLLNADNNTAWHQNLFADALPTLDVTRNVVTGGVDVEGDVTTVMGNLVLTTNYEVAEGKTLLIPADATVTTTGNAVITNNGTIIANGSIAGNDLASNGSFIYNVLGNNDVALVETSVTYKGADFTLDDDLEATISPRTFCGKDFTFDDSETTVSYENNHYVGENATVTWTNNNGSSVSKTFSISPKTLTISNIAAANKTYDGNEATTVSYDADVCESDIDYVTFGTAAAFADKNAGTGKTVSFNYTMSGEQAGNYAFADETGTTTANIEQLELVISKTEAADKVYDGNEATTVTIEASNIIEGDKVEFGTEAAFADKNVGTNKDVNFTYTKSGDNANNYKFAATNGTVKAAISARELTLSDFAADNKVYDGTAEASGSFADNRVSGDVLEFSYTVEFDNEAAANGKNVSFSSIAISGGADKDNYSLVTTEGSATANITPKEVSLAWSNTALVYNGAEQIATATVGGLIGEDECAVTAVSGAQKNAGTYTATATTLSNTNYKLPADATSAFAIAAKEVSLAWSNTALVYNGAEQIATATAEGLIGEDACTVTVEGAATNVGNYTATATALNNDNYKLPAAVTSAFTIAPKEVSLVWSNTEFVYNGKNQIATATAEGLIGEDACTVTVEGAAKNAGTHTATATALSNANYKLPAAATSAFTIAPKEVSLAWSDTTLTYNGAAQAAIATAQGLEEGEECTVTVGGKQTNIGSYTATATALSNSNYKLPEAVTSGFTIAPKTGVVVTITENSSEVVYNTKEQKAEGYTYSINDELGIYSEDDFAFSGNAVVVGTTVGTYPMELSAADFSNLNTNYADVEFVVEDGALTITKAAVAPNKPAATMETQYINTQLVVLPENWKWAEFAALAEGDNTATANYDGTDKGNYVVESVAVSIKRLPCPHNQGNELLYTLEPTCTHNGYTGNLSCKLCGEIYEYGDSIPALGHAYDTVVVAATCTTGGYKELTCSRCGDVTHIDVVPAAGHTAGEPVVENFTAPTCTEAGSVDTVVYCTIDTVEISRVHVVLDALGHKADSVVKENVVAATYEAAGSYELVTYCSVCGAEISRDTIEVPQLVKPVEPEVIEIVVKKVDYNVGDSLNLEGGKIVIATSDSTTAEIVITPDMVSGFNPDSVGVQTVTVKIVIDSVVYITTFEITVKAAEQPVVAQSVKVTAPAKVEYKQGEALDVTGGKLTVTFSDNTTKEVDLKAEMVSGFDADKVGEQKLTVTYKVDNVTLTATFSVTVAKADNTAIADVAAEISIYAYRNTIVVENATDDIFIYNAMGALVGRINAEAGRTEIRVETTGVYVVKTGNAAKRVMVY